MAYGLEVDNVEITDKGLIVIDVRTITGTSSTSYSSWSGRTLYYSLYPNNNSLGHTISISGTTVSWTAVTISGGFFTDAPNSNLVVYVR